jgi:squalene-hopene/tetraprenyl-beta-curcumene cyclase
MVRSMVSTGGSAEREVLKAARDLAVHPRESSFVPTEAVMVASVLAIYDSRTSGALDPSTRFALDRMWQLQRDDGGWDWIHNNKPPSEVDDDYGVTMAAIGVGLAPEKYAETPLAREGIRRIRSYLSRNPPVNLHNRAMRLLASSRVRGILDRASCQDIVSALLEAQHADGGWGLATLGRNWQRADGSSQDYGASDGYGTGFVIYVLRTAGVSAQDPAIQKGIGWLKANQRVSGAWFTRSMEKDGKHYVTNPGTAFAVMALLACGEKIDESPALQKDN